MITWNELKEAIEKMDKDKAKRNVQIENTDRGAFFDVDELGFIDEKQKNGDMIKDVPYLAVEVDES